MKSRSLFSPLLLIAVGLIWMLINLGAVPSTNLWALYSYGPYFILTLGIGLVLRARWELAGRIVSALAVGLAVLAVVFAAPLGWDKALEWGCFSEGYPGKDCSWFRDFFLFCSGSAFLLPQQQRPNPVDDRAKGQFSPWDDPQPARDIDNPPRAQHQFPDAQGHIIGSYAHMLGRDVPTILL